MAHPRNDRLAALIAAAGLSHAQVARAFVRVALEAGAQEFAGVGRSHVSHWVAGSRPSGRGPAFLCEALSRRLGRAVTLDEIGLAEEATTSRDRLDWRADTLTMLADLRRADMDAGRRRVLSAAAFSVAALALPGQQWWAQMADRGRTRTAAGAHLVGRGDVEAVREMTQAFSRIDQRRGGGHARTTVVRYLTVDVAGYLRGAFPMSGYAVRCSRLRVSLPTCRAGWRSTTPNMPTRNRASRPR